MFLSRPPQRFDSLGTLVAERDEQHLVLVQLDEVVEPALQADQVVGDQPAQEDAKLPA
jgi:hypothetical protein